MVYGCASGRHSPFSQLRFWLGSWLCRPAARLRRGILRLRDSCRELLGCPLHRAFHRLASPAQEGDVGVVQAVAGVHIHIRPHAVALAVDDHCAVASGYGFGFAAVVVVVRFHVYRLCQAALHCNIYFHLFSPSQKPRLY